ECDVAVFEYTPFHRPPARDDVLGALLAGLRGPILLADCYQSGQHYVEAEGVLASYPEARGWVKYEAEITVPALLESGRLDGVHRGVSRGSLDTLPLPAGGR